MCGKQTAVISRKGDRILCWWLLPAAIASPTPSAR
jgi:hypothetical protein